MNFPQVLAVLAAIASFQFLGKVEAVPVEQPDLPIAQQADLLVVIQLSICVHAIRSHYRPNYYLSENTLNTFVREVHVQWNGHTFSCWNKRTASLILSIKTEDALELLNCFALVDIYNLPHLIDAALGLNGRTWNPDIQAIYDQQIVVTRQFITLTTTSLFNLHASVNIAEVCLANPIWHGWTIQSTALTELLILESIITISTRANEVSALLVLWRSSYTNWNKSYKGIPTKFPGLYGLYEKIDYVRKEIEQLIFQQFDDLTDQLCLNLIPYALSHVGLYSAKEILTESQISAIKYSFWNWA